jgi:hypothetical protein
VGRRLGVEDKMKNYDLERIEIMIERVAPDQLARAIEVLGDMRFAHLSVLESIEIVETNDHVRLLTQRLEEVLQTIALESEVSLGPWVWEELLQERDDLEEELYGHSVPKETKV